MGPYARWLADQFEVDSTSMASGEALTVILRGWACSATGMRSVSTPPRNAAIGTSGTNALASMGAAYRGFAHDHPGQFASTLLPPRSPELELGAANQALLDVFTLVYGAMGLDPDASNLAARSTRSAIHGFLALEHTTGTTPAHDVEYQHLLETLSRGLAS